ncbi:MAG: SpoIIE family protein phosphatase, partial [Candidatus Eremiobacteraeota bacterium]|nr:SpoIIE family protein phosphatase [Candidatus Eremiobacteraeota bacterium]
GIPAAEQQHVFERFRRVRVAKSRSHEGSGIGLALVKDLVNLHGGSIDVESEPGAGSTFVVRLPFGSSHLDPAAVVETPSAPHSRDTREQYLAEVDSTTLRASSMQAMSSSPTGAQPRRRVLLADDNGDLRDYVSRLLSPQYDVTAVHNGVEALAAARSQGFDAILSDVMMPEMDGLELLKAVRADVQLATTPFIMLSARAGEEHAVEGVTAGADDYIAKPFSAEELLARLRANLNASAVRRRAWELSEERFRAFADRLPMMIWQMDASGAVTFTNAAWHAITRLPRNPSSYTEEAWKSIVHPADFQRVIPQMYGAIAERKPFGFEYRVKPTDGDDETYRWYIASGELQHVEGVFVGWTGYVVDIHDSREREEMERDLRRQATERERAFHALAEAVPVIVWSADAGGWLDWYNNRWYEYTGQTPAEAAGWGWQAVHHPEDLPRVMAEWPHSVATGEKFEMEFRLRRHDGAYHWFLTRAEPLRDESGQVARWYGSNVDIQAQKDILEQSKRVAETLQSVFLPGALPRTDKVSFDAVYVAAERDAFIGGDWYDAVELPDGRIVVSIGDVAGHGIDASVIAGAIRQEITSLALDEADPAEILRNANRLMRFQYPDKYATAVVGVIDRECTTLEYASAGHPPPLLAEANAMPARALVAGGIPLGIQDELQSVSRRIPLRQGAVLAFYTDGLTEFARDIEAAERTLELAVSNLVDDSASARPAAT